MYLSLEESVLTSICANVEFINQENDPFDNDNWEGRFAGNLHLSYIYTCLKEEILLVFYFSVNRTKEP